jgi:carbamoyl-phosphate synthase large subunit
LTLDGEIIAADAGRNAPASFIANRRIQVPRVADPNYVNCLLDACSSLRVGLLFPLIDTDLRLLARDRERFEAIGTTVVVSSLATTELCFDKNATYRFFRDHDIETPRVFDPSELASLPDSIFPLLIKPYDGSAGAGVVRVERRADLAFFRGHIENAMVQEFIEGQEFTVDVLVGFDGQIGCIVPRRRIEVRAGEVSKSVTVKSRAIMDASRKVVESLPGALGCITVQCFLEPDGRIRFTEINPRFGGGFPLALHAGADFPRWLIEEYLGRSANVYRDDWIDDLAMLRYDDEIIVQGSEIR